MSDGRFVRQASSFRDWITSAGRFEPASDRYHLYVSHACPWAHRTLITRHFKGLQDAIGVTVVEAKMGTEGWEFAAPDPVNGATRLSEIYVKARPDVSTRVTVPVLWDKETSSIVNNESREVMRMLDTAFDEIGDGSVTLRPSGYEERIEQVLDRIYPAVNNGVYRTGFARTQEAYEEAVRELFRELDHWEEVLGDQRFLCGELLTEADVAMYTTLVRFDTVYHSHFKCNLRRVQDYPNLWGYLRDLYARPAFRKTTHFDHIKLHYFWSHETINPSRVVPVGPSVDFEQPHDRDRFE